MLIVLNNKYIKKYLKGSKSCFPHIPMDQIPNKPLTFNAHGNDKTQYHKVKQQ